MDSESEMVILRIHLQRHHDGVAHDAVIYGQAFIRGCSYGFTRLRINYERKREHDVGKNVNVTPNSTSAPIIVSCHIHFICHG